jgi:acyl-CoA thioesterase-1
MKKIIFPFCVMGTILFFCFNACDMGSAHVNTGVSLVCLGDSLTAGYGATTPGEDDSTKSYPAYLQNKLNIPVINAGKSGDTTSEALSRVNTDVLNENPRIVIIELGANDLFQWFSSETTEKNLQGVKDLLATTKNNLQEIINLIDDGNRKIYIAKFYTEAVAKAMADEFGIPDSVQTLLINRYDAMFAALASSNNVILIDDIWNGIGEDQMSDAVHPNAAGYALMADNYYKAMEPYLEANNLLSRSMSLKYRTVPTLSSFVAASSQTMTALGCI